MSEENKIILYQDDNEITRVSVRFADEDLWLTQNQLAEIYSTTKQNISQHIDNILNNGELDLNILTVAELRDLAKKKEVKGYSKMKKEELIENLK